jgi:hypothetical protein
MIDDYYSKKKLESKEAKETVVLPDRKMLPSKIAREHAPAKLTVARDVPSAPSSSTTLPSAPGGPDLKDDASPPVYYALHYFFVFTSLFVCFVRGACDP